VVEEWYSAVIARYKPGSTQAAKSYRLLKSILNRAVRAQEIEFNPCQIKGAGYERPKERPIPESDDEVQAIADAIRTLPHGDR
jgi:hypothetical protein